MNGNAIDQWNNLGAALQPPADLAAPYLIDVPEQGHPRTYTFAAFSALLQAVAGGLLARGLKPGDRVGILSANRVEYLAVFFAAMQAGLVPVPLNIKLPQSTLTYILADADIKLVFRDHARASVQLGLRPTVDFPSHEGETGSFEDFLVPGMVELVTPGPNEPAMFLYTSGSTGVPKGVVLSHESHLWVLAMRRRPSGANPARVLVAAPLYHMNALSTIHAALAQGDSAVLLPSFEAARYLHAATQFRCTMLTTVPSMFSMILKRPELLAAADLSSVNALRMGSAPVTPALHAALREVFPSAAISNVYGTTEAGPIVFTQHPDGAPTPEGSLGIAHPQVQLRIEGSAAGEAEGVLEIRCPAVMTRYEHKPELTRAVFTRDGFYRTGDVFRRDAAGFYFYVGRVDDMFSCGGENIYPGDVESMLERHPAIQQAAVVPVPDEIKGAKPVAFVILRRGHTVTEEEVRLYALSNAPAYQHPRRVWVVPELPLSGTNKIDKKALAALARASLGSAGDPK